jgi:bifunctional non-homologous end joining protein LigD
VPRRKGKRLEFVVQEHHASHLHYDFRLELDGVLKSWAVPKGPSLDPARKRLAVEVEDHPLPYAKFAGKIPAGEYGAGVVYRWDRGTWEPVGDPEEGLQKGRLEFSLKGKKLQGNWILLRTRNAAKGKSQWLLIKRADAFAVKGHEAEARDSSPTLQLTEAPALPSRGTVPAHPRPRGVRSGVVAKAGRSSSDLRGKPARRLSAPRESARGARIEVGDLSNADRVLFDRPKITKGELAEIYHGLAPWILPHVSGRPLSLIRCPDGLSGKCFFQKHFHGKIPSSIQQHRRRGKGGDFLSIDSAVGLVALVQYGTIELHAQNSRLPAVNRPDQIVMDFDPGPGVTWKATVQAAFAMKEMLECLGLRSFAKVTGGKGIHVHVPFAARYDWDAVRIFAETLARELSARNPGCYTAKLSKRMRRGKIFVDYLRNGEGNTAVVPYTVRAREGAPVALPVDWEELGALKGGHAFSIVSARRRLRERKRDPWADYFTIQQRISVLEPEQLAA